MTNTTTRAGWISECVVVVLVVTAVPAMAQATPFERIFNNRPAADRVDLRETMRREHRERSERGLSSGFVSPDTMDHSEQNRDADVAARRARWQRLSPDERQQLRRDVHQAGRDIYPQFPRRDGN